MKNKLLSITRMFMNANLICLLLGSCDNDKIDATISETHVLPSQVATRAAYDNNFDWENSSTVTLVGMKETTHGVPLPWTTLGLPIVQRRQKKFFINEIDNTYTSTPGEWRALGSLLP